MDKEKEKKRQNNFKEDRHFFSSDEKNTFQQVASRSGMNSLRSFPNWNLGKCNIIEIYKSISFLSSILFSILPFFFSPFNSTHHCPTSSIVISFHQFSSTSISNWYASSASIENPGIPNIDKCPPKVENPTTSRTIPTIGLNCHFLGCYNPTYSIYLPSLLLINQISNRELSLDGATNLHRDMPTATLSYTQLLSIEYFSNE